MSNYLPTTLGIVAMLVVSTALAKERSPLESASVKAATDCVAVAALKDGNIVTLYRENRLKEITDRLVLRSSACDSPFTAMRLLHDRLYGAGTGQKFLLGDYLADLPRAVRERIKGEMDKRIASETGDDALESYAMRNGSEDPDIVMPGPSFRPVTPKPRLAECESSSATDTLARVVQESLRGRRLEIEVFKVDSRTLRSTTAKNFCAALLWTSAGKQLVNYTIEWMNRETGRFWVEFRWM
jgi:hypothetical protein